MVDHSQPITDEWVEVTDGTTLPGDRFSYTMDTESGVGKITSHKRIVAGIDTVLQPKGAL